MMLGQSARGKTPSTFFRTDFSLGDCSKVNWPVLESESCGWNLLEHDGKISSKTVKLGGTIIIAGD